MASLTARIRVVAIAALPATALGLLVLTAFLGLRIEAAETALRQRGNALAREFAISVAPAISAGDRAQVAAHVAGMLSLPGVRRVRVWSDEGEYGTWTGPSQPLMSRPALAGGNEGRHVLRSPPASVISDRVQPLLSTGTAHAAQRPSVAVAVSMRRHADETRREVALLGGGSLVVLGTALLCLIWLGRTAASVRLGRVRATGRAQRERRLGARRLADGATACANPAADRSGSGMLVPEGGREERAAATLAEVAKARFLAAASHDLRQPVHALGLFVNLLERRAHAPETAEIVQRIGQSVKTIGALLDSLLDISRLDCGAVKPEPRAIPVQDVFDRLADVGALTIDKGLGWRVRSSREWIHSDPELLERALRILLSNALRYTEAGSVMLATRRRGEFLRIEVRDSGIGIDWPSQALVFQEFVQLGNAERDRHKGLGLGLPIVLRLGRLLHHPIGLRSAPGRGSVFWIEAPLAEASGSDQRSTLQRGELAGRKVALIDDDPGLLARAAGLLSAWGCRVYAGRSRRDVERALESTPPDLILCSDRVVGDESGLEAVDRMRLIYGTSIPAIVMTDDDPARMPPLGRRQLSVLAKPLRPAKLRATLRAWLERVAEPL